MERKHLVGVVATLILLTCAPALAQVVDTVRPNPDAVLLRRAWTLRGPNAFDNYGTSVAGLGDINKDGFDDLGVVYDWAAHVYYGDSTGARDTSSYRKDSAFSMRDVAVGDFWGTGHKALAVKWDSLVDPSHLTYVSRYFFFRTDSNRIEADPAATFLAFSKDGSHHYLVRAVAAVDLDNDGYDEFLAASVLRAYTTRNADTIEILIFRGGPEFQVDTPAVIIRDVEANNGQQDLRFAVGNLDGDDYVDIMYSAHYDRRSAPAPARMKVYFGGPRLKDLDRDPDRVIDLNSKIYFVSDDFDGDDADDLAICAFDDGFGISAGVDVFLSTTGKSARSRAYNGSDADRLLEMPGAFPMKIGPINDSTGRYSALGIRGVGFRGMLLVLSGGPKGPDAQFEAFYSTERDGMSDGEIFQDGGPDGNFNGDRYSDLLYANSQWTELQYGLVVMLVGGAYIPQDSGSVSAAPSVAHDALERLRLFPNPTRSALRVEHLEAMSTEARRLVVFDLRGRVVLDQAIQAGSQLETVDCRAFQSGLYLLCLRDARGITTSATTFQKR